MNLSISEIAWPLESEAAAAQCLKKLSVSCVELAPFRCFGNPLEADEGTVRQRADEIRSLGLEPRSFQALLFGHEGLALFDSKGARDRMMAVLKSVAQVACWAGAGPMVFGSPKNRLRGGMSLNEADRIAIGFFREVGDYCAECGSCLVLEANPEQYGADYITRLDQAADLVARVDSPGFRLHVDAGGLALSGEDFDGVVREARALIAHVHASQPMLASFQEPHQIHQRLASILQKIGYANDVTIEMRAQASEVEAVQEAIDKVKSIYFA